MPISLAQDCQMCVHPALCDLAGSALSAGFAVVLHHTGRVFQDLHPRSCPVSLSVPYQLDSCSQSSRLVLAPFADLFSRKGVLVPSDQPRNTLAPGSDTRLPKLSLMFVCSLHQRAEEITFPLELQRLRTRLGNMAPS